MDDYAGLWFDIKGSGWDDFAYQLMKKYIGLLEERSGDDAHLSMVLARLKDNYGAEEDFLNHWMPLDKYGRTIMMENVMVGIEGLLTPEEKADRERRFQKWQHECLKLIDEELTKDALKALDEIGKHEE